MGAMKDYYTDLMNGRQRWVSNVYFVCPVCEKPVQQEVEVPEPNYAGEKSSDMVSEGEVELHCESCDTYFDGDVWAGPAHCDIDLREYSETSVSCDPPSYDRPPEDWFDDWQIPDDPTAVFKLNASELKTLIDAHAKADGSSLMNRMIFAQIFSFMEAFLCDSLVSAFRRHPDRLADFAAKDGSISQTEFKAADILRDPDYVRKAVEHSLKSRIYHQFGSAKADKNGKAKLEGVPLWYAIAFGFTLSPSEDDLDKLRKYASLRHDCVHRNGKTKEGDILNTFSKGYLIEALILAGRFVDHIDSCLTKFDADQDARKQAQAGVFEDF
jgi:hypothetical protein